MSKYLNLLSWIRNAIVDNLLEGKDRVVGDLGEAASDIHRKYLQINILYQGLA